MPYAHGSVPLDMQPVIDEINKFNDKRKDYYKEHEEISFKLPFETSDSYTVSTKHIDSYPNDVARKTAASSLKRQGNKQQNLRLQGLTNWLARIYTYNLQQAAEIASKRNVTYGSMAKQMEKLFDHLEPVPNFDLSRFGNINEPFGAEHLVAITQAVSSEITGPNGITVDYNPINNTFFTFLLTGNRSLATSPEGRDLLVLDCIGLLNPYTSIAGRDSFILEAKFYKEALNHELDNVAQMYENYLNHDFPRDHVSFLDETEFLMPWLLMHYYSHFEDPFTEKLQEDRYETAAYSDVLQLCAARTGRAFNMAMVGDSYTAFIMSTKQKTDLFDDFAEHIEAVPPNEKVYQVHQLISFRNKLIAMERSEYPAFLFAEAIEGLDNYVAERDRYMTLGFMLNYFGPELNESLEPGYGGDVNKSAWHSWLDLNAKGRDFESDMVAIEELNVELKRTAKTLLERYFITDFDSHYPGWKDANIEIQKV